jgi:hypothetical protein
MVQCMGCKDNMRFVNLIVLSDFIQVLNILRKHPTKNEYFPMHILFTTIYLLQEQELNPRIYSKQELIMSIFVQATDHVINLHAKIQYLILHRFLKLNSSRFG